MIAENRVGILGCLDAAGAARTHLITHRRRPLGPDHVEYLALAVGLLGKRLIAVEERAEHLLRRLDECRIEPPGPSAEARSALVELRRLIASPIVPRESDR